MKKQMTTEQYIEDSFNQIRENKYFIKIENKNFNLKIKMLATENEFEIMKKALKDSNTFSHLINVDQNFDNDVNDANLRFSNSKENFIFFSGSIATVRCFYDFIKMENSKFKLLEG